MPMKIYASYEGGAYGPAHTARLRCEDDSTVRDLLARFAEHA